MGQWAAIAFMCLALSIDPIDGVRHLIVAEKANIHQDQYQGIERIHLDVEEDGLWMSESENTTVDNTILESVNMTAEEVTEVEAALEDAFGFLWTADASDLVDGGPKLPTLPNLPSFTMPKLPSLNISGKMNAISESLSNKMKSLSNKMDAAFETMSKSFTYVKMTLSPENLKKQGEKAAKAVEKAFKALNKAIERSLQAARTYALKFSNMLSSALSGMKNLLTRLKNFPLKKVMFAAITAGFKKLQSMWRSAMESVGSALVQVREVVARIDIKASLNAAWTAASEVMTKLLNHGWRIFEASAKTAKKFVGFLVHGFTWMVDGRMAAALMGAIKGLFGAVMKGAIAVFWDSFHAVQAVWVFVAEGVPKGVAAVWKAMEWTATKAVGVLKATPAAMGKVIFAIPGILQASVEAVQAGAAKVLEMLQSIKNAIPGAIEKAKKICTDLGNTFALLIKNIIAEAKSGVLACFETLQSSWKALKAITMTALGKVWTEIGKLIEKAILFLVMYPIAIVVQVWNAIFKRNSDPPLMQVE